jgi:epoxyqueuosine reductase
MNAAGTTGHADWLERTFGRLLLEAPENRLPDAEDRPIFDSPALGVADGDDPLFELFLAAVSPRHLRPRAFLERQAPSGSDLSHVCVVTWAFPYTDEVRRSNRAGDWPSPLYSLARNRGGVLTVELGRRLAQAIERLGFAAVSPALAEDYDTFRVPNHVYGSTWSERHAAYAAGLGRFGLSGALITRLGIHVRLGSLITNLPLEAATPSLRAGHRAPCLEDAGLCGRCVERCPVGAISETGLNKVKCNEMRKAVQEKSLSSGPDRARLLPTLQSVNGRKAWRYPLGCALCQCGVPCEGSDPFR